MGTTTSNFNLIKPAKEDFYSIEDQNSNMEIIDAELKASRDAIINHNHDGRYETPEEAQTKATAAEAAAKNYTDQKDESIKTQINAHLSDTTNAHGINNKLGTIAFNSHEANLYAHGIPAAVNLLPDSGRFMGKINPLLQASPVSFVESNMFLPYNGASPFRSAGKFIHNNTTNGGAAGTLSQEVIDLLNTMSAMGLRFGTGLRWGVEFYIAETTSGSGTYPSGASGYSLLTANNGLAFGGKYVTLSCWVRVKSGGTLSFPVFSKLLRNGVVQNTSLVVITPSDGWVHIETTDWDYNIGYNSGFPNMGTDASGTVVQIALPAIVSGQIGVGLHSAPIPTINELSEA